MRTRRSSDRAFYGVSVLLFAGSAWVTIVWCASMSAMGGTPMSGGWTMSMTWMRAPGQSWLGAATSFLAGWVVMTGAMMLPSLVPALRRYRDAAAAAHATRVGGLTALVGAGYFFVWTLVGTVIFPLGVTLSAVLMRQPALAHSVPIAVGAVVLLTGMLQLTPRKLHQLECWTSLGHGAPVQAHAPTAWRHGLCLGVHCVRCSAGTTATLLAVGLMDLRVMAVVTAAITAERLAPRGARVARAIGGVAIAAGSLLIARAVGSG